MYQANPPLYEGVLLPNTGVYLEPLPSMNRPRFSGINQDSTDSSRQETPQQGPAPRKRVTVAVGTVLVLDRSISLIPYSVQDAGSARLNAVGKQSEVNRARTARQADKTTFADS